MAVRSRRLAVSNVNVPGGNQVIYTCPAGRTAIIRRLSVVNDTGAARRIRLAVRINSVNTFIAQVDVLPDRGHYIEEDTNLVLNPGDALSLVTDATSPTTGVYVSLSGSLLLGEPE